MGGDSRCDAYYETDSRTKELKKNNCKYQIYTFTQFGPCSFLRRGRGSQRMGQEWVFLRGRLKLFRTMFFQVIIFTLTLDIILPLRLCHVFENIFIFSSSKILWKKVTLSNKSQQSVYCKQIEFTQHIFKQIEIGNLIDF